MSQSECFFNYELLIDYASKNASQEQCTLVERHLAKCQCCRQQVMSMEKTWWALDVWQDDAEEEAPLPIGGFRERLAAEKNKKPVWQRAVSSLRITVQSYMQPVRWVPATAITAVAAGLLVIPFINLENSPIPQNSVVADGATAQDAAEPQPQMQLAKADVDPSGGAALEERFNNALLQGRRHESQESRNRANTSLARGNHGINNVQAVGFTPNQQIWSAMDEQAAVMMTPSYVVPSTKQR